MSSVQTVWLVQPRSTVGVGLRVRYCASEHSVQTAHTVPSSPQKPALHWHERSLVAVDGTEIAAFAWHTVRLAHCLSLTAVFGTDSYSLAG